MISSIWLLGLLLLILLMGIFVKDKKLAITFIAIITVGVAGMILYNNGIYIDERNLSGNPLNLILFLISIVLLIILVVVNQKTDDK